MPTDEERREVAARLRELPRTADADGCCTACDVLFALGLEWCDVIGFVKAVDAARLADLIDRPTTTLTEDEDGRTCCANCGCTALYMSDAVYCPDCGAEVTRNE